MNVGKEIARYLVETHDVQGALDKVLARYEDPMKSCVAAAGMISRVRMLIYTDDRNRRPGYLEELEGLLAELDDPDDVITVCDLSEATLQVQYHAFASKKPVLRSAWADEELKSISPLFEAFMDFCVPAKIARHRSDLRFDVDMAKHTAVRPNYILTHVEADKIRKIAVAVLHEETQAPQTMMEALRLLSALQIVSGRRNFEIVHSLVATSNGKPFQCHVSGLCKQTPVEETDIPLLVECDVFLRRLAQLREFQPLSGISSSRQLTHRGQQIKDAGKKLFGRAMSHTQKRNLYVELAWARRFEENQFLVEDGHCSKMLFVKKALGHQIQQWTPTDAYQTMMIVPGNDAQAVFR